MGLFIIIWIFFKSITRFGTNTSATLVVLVSIGAFLFNLRLQVDYFNKTTVLKSYRAMLTKVIILMDFVMGCFIFATVCWPQYLSADVSKVDNQFMRCNISNEVKQQAYILPKVAKETVILMEEISEYLEVTQDSGTVFDSQQDETVLLYHEKMQDVIDEIEAISTYLTVYLLFKVLSFVFKKAGEFGFRIRKTLRE